ncbi:shikimate kinase [bacterium]|nr:shikimate kinase [bacterium]
MSSRENTTRTNIILTGFMATGKTTIGKLLAGQLGYEFVDTDHLIENRCGQTVAEIFQEKGETVFRAMETEVARELGEKEGLVIATGGGLVLNPVNVTALEIQGRIFCMVATPGDILKRASRDTAVRPLLQGKNPEERITELMQARKEAYSHFAQVETTGKTPDEVTAMLLFRLFHET